MGSESEEKSEYSNESDNEDEIKKQFSNDFDNVSKIRKFMYWYKVN